MQTQEDTLDIPSFLKAAKPPAPAPVPYYPTLIPKAALSRAKSRPLVPSTLELGLGLGLFKATTGELSDDIMRNRETWFRSLAEALKPFFAEHDLPLYQYRVSCGWTSAGVSRNVLGECWHRTVSADLTAEIFVTPLLSDKIAAASVLFHELGHAACPAGTGHQGPFITLMKAAGLSAPWTSAGAPSNTTPEFQVFILKYLKQAGEYPHAALLGKDWFAPGDTGKRTPGRPKATFPMPEGRKRKQTYLLKASCDDCGYTVRVTAKWAKLGTPTCPNLACDKHGHDMTVED